MASVDEVVAGEILPAREAIAILDQVDYDAQA